MLSDDPKVRLLEAAGQIFAEKGFKGGTVREISQRAGANIAAVNYYFRDKEGLYIEAVKAASCGSGEDLAVPAWAPGTLAEVKLCEFIQWEVRHILGCHSKPWHRQLIMQELASPTPACAEL